MMDRSTHGLRPWRLSRTCLCIDRRPNKPVHIHAHERENVKIKQAAMEALEEAQERYAQARARREKFLMEAQRNFQVRVRACGCAVRCGVCVCVAFP